MADRLVQLYWLSQVLTTPLLLGSQLKRRRRRLLRARLTPPSIAHPKVIWVHTLSVGEVEAALPLLKALKEGLPDYFLLFTVTTAAGFNHAQKRASLVDLLWPGPLDWWPVVRRYLRAFHPRAFILVESDLWPGLLWSLKRKGVPLIWANAAFSSRSARRLKKLKFLAPFLLGPFDYVAAASQGDARRLAIFLPPEKISYFGNLKGEVPRPSGQKVASLKKELEPFLKRPVLIAGSTHAGEEEVILAAFKELKRGSLILCPRHPERAKAVKTLAEREGMRACLRTRPQPAEVMVVDTLGELRALYALADLAFVGGTLVPVGGHNLLEPLAWGRPILVGPYLESVADVARLLKQEGVLFEVASREELVRSWRYVLEHLCPLQKKATILYQKNRNISAKYVKLLKKVLTSQGEE